MIRRVGIIGVGNSKFGRRDDVSVQELAWESIKEAFNDSGITQRDVNFVVVGSTAYRGIELYPAPLVAEYSGLTGKVPMRVEAMCATGLAAALTAYTAVASGLADIAMAVGVDKMTEVDTSTSLAIGGRGGNYQWEYHFYGTTFPTYYALYATRHMAVYGTTEEQMALVAVKAHKYGSLNPKAHFQKPITVDDVLKSRVVSWPIKLLDSCPISDGSATAIFASEEKIKELKIDTPVWVTGIGYANDYAYVAKRGEWTGFKATQLASHQAYQMAKINPNQVEVATVHDAFTIAEIMGYEDLGFVKKGAGGKFIQEGQSEKGGKVGVNLFGGLKAKGHPLGATGLSMIYEITKQLRDEAGPLQQPLKNYVGLVHNVGGTGHFAYVMILRR
ncbi:acetyl-CoA acetyltransferase [Sulfolobus sp. A20]|uniref:thiolase domain-containing protein n=1 Tax=Saccharolobus sp. A20 TaxID=1891280 RepID=UPI0008461F1C|nr:thiolase domain-containing protein [Sulfolobus sp. A20]TRM78122.1 thiolase domain-containing protein [Sulfolobus sp. B5]TRM78754.1 thiolase domain-containing protein [Sulfolobus sp. A20-N-F8]TRM83510.1 thiolase domain-containing protein [Sulfolobus sp. A20-N-F6]TRM88107.1 thiolase domain-containing protein [Sulfolobus sp. C3]TRM93429.1 thiolase domain-containing protein [Sulfolobus sp. A20-N-G8]